MCIIWYSWELCNAIEQGVLWLYVCMRHAIFTFKTAVCIIYVGL